MKNTESLFSDQALEVFSIEKVNHLQQTILDKPDKTQNLSEVLYQAYEMLTDEQKIAFMLAGGVPSLFQYQFYMTATWADSHRETNHLPGVLRAQGADIPLFLKQETLPLKPEYTLQKKQASGDPHIGLQKMTRRLPIEDREVRIAPKNMALLREPGIHLIHKRADVIVSIPEAVYVDLKTRSRRKKFPSAKFANLVLKEFPNSITRKYDFSYVFVCFGHGSHRITIGEWDIYRIEMDANTF